MSDPLCYRALWEEFLSAYINANTAWSHCGYCFESLDPADPASQLHREWCIIGRVQAQLLKDGRLKGQLRLLPLAR